MKTLVLLTEKQLKALLKAKEWMDSEKSKNGDWDNLVEGRAPEGQPVSSWMREMWEESKKKKKKKKEQRLREQEEEEEEGEAEFQQTKTSTTQDCVCVQCKMYPGTH